MPDPIRKHFGYGQLWPLWPACSQDWAGSYLPDLTSHILFSSVFPKETWIILYKADPDLIWMACQGLAKCIWSGSKSMCRNHQARFLAGCNHRATSFPLSDSVAFCHRWPGSYRAKPARIWFASGWLCQVLAKEIPSGSKPVCKNHLTHFWPMLPSQSGSDTNRFWHVYWASRLAVQQSNSVPSTNAT